MASNRDPRKDYRINRRGRKVTSSADRSKRAKKASAPKPTSSSTRSRGKGTGSKRVTQGNESARTGISTRRQIEGNKPKVTKGQGGKPRRPSPSTKVRRTGLKLKGTWANTQAEEMKMNKKVGANNKESALMNNERLKQSTDAKQERAQRLSTRNKVVKGPGNKAVRKKPVTGPPRGASGPRNPPVQGPSRKTPNIVADIPNRGNKPKTGGPPGLGKVKFDPKNRVKPKTGGGIGQLRGLGTAALAGALATGSMRNPISKAKEKEYRRKEAEAGKKRKMPSMGKDYKSKEKDLSRKANASNFDNAFAKARKAGKSTFTWRGKKYTTKKK